MHALGQYLTEEIARRGWTASELARRSGLTKQSISNLMADDKTLLGRGLERRTFVGLAKALNVPLEQLAIKAAQAMNHAAVPPPPRDNHLDDAPTQTMEDLEAFLKGLPVPLLVSYLHRYLRLADVVGQAIAERSEAPAIDGEDPPDDPPGPRLAWAYGAGWTRAVSRESVPPPAYDSSLTRNGLG